MVGSRGEPSGKGGAEDRTAPPACPVEFLFVAAAHSPSWGPRGTVIRIYEPRYSMTAGAR